MAKNNNQVTGWVGWIGFASFMLYLAGFFSIVAGLVALFTDTVYVIGEQAIWALDYTQWGWIHIIVGVLALVAGGSLMQGKGFGRVIAVLVAFSSAVANMLFIPIYPIWALLIIVIDVLIIYAVIVHGGEMKDLQ